MLTTLVVMLLYTASCNVVYMLSSIVTTDATDGSGVSLAVLLFIYGTLGPIGNWLGECLTDRQGNRFTGTIFLTVHAIVLLTIIPTLNSFAAMAIVFALWSVAAYGIATPIQHRLIENDRVRADLSLSWYSTAMYIGIAIAPLAGSWALTGGTSVLLISAAPISLAAHGYLTTRRLAPRA